MEVLDLFSAAAGGWSLGMHRAGFKTIAACEFIDWRRALYQQNNPGVRIYDDVRTLTADQLHRDLGRLPDVIVGSPPCQDISSANTKGKGVEGKRSSLYFDAIRIIGECRPRWFALENSSNLRTRGADAVLSAMEAIGYSCWTFVVRAGDIGANHERPRCWIIGCDVGQVTNPDGIGWHEGWSRGRRGIDLPISDDPIDAKGLRHEGWGARRAGQDRNREAYAARVVSSDTKSVRGSSWAGHDLTQPEHQGENEERRSEMDRSESACGYPAEPWAEWNHGITGHLRVDDGLSSWLAGTRVAVGGAKGTVASSLIVEAFGDAVVPQIPEAIGLAILRTEAALAVIYGRSAA